MNLLPLSGARRALSWIFVGGFSFSLLFFGGVFLEARNSVALTLDEISKNFRDAVEAFSIADTGETRSRLDAAHRGADQVLGRARWVRSVPVIGSLFNTAVELSGQSLDLINILDELAANGFEWLFADGRELVSRLQALKRGIEDIDELSAAIRNRASRFGIGSSFSGEYLVLQSNTRSATEFLDGLLDFLSGEKRLLLVFENPSEIRPAGGFTGSYADVALKDGQILSIDVRDIAYPDTSLRVKVMPPSPLQGIARSWGARDANWFFDFPLSAEKILGFLEASDVYAPSRTSFDAVVAINHHVVQDILLVTGPAELSRYRVTLTAENFLKEVQEEVSTDAYERGSSRKDILKDLTPIITARLRTLDEAKRKELYARLSERLAGKDIKFYSRDGRLQNFFTAAGWAGESYSFPADFFGDYLAVANANVMSGKTDAVVTQSLSLKSKLDETGTLSSELSLTRAHRGDKERLSFYRVPNEDYVRVVLPSGTRILSRKGESKKRVVPLASYARGGYETDADLAEWEAGVESGKAWFGQWLITPRGGTRTLTLTYERPGALSEKEFQFVYDKQSGVETSLSYTLEAPPGYVFKETGRSEFHYEAARVPARVLFTVTLEKI